MRLVHVTERVETEERDALQLLVENPRALIPKYRWDDEHEDEAEADYSEELKALMLYRKDIIRLNQQASELIRLNPKHTAAYKQYHADALAEITKKIAALKIPGLQLK